MIAFLNVTVGKRLTDDQQPLQRTCVMLINVIKILIIIIGQVIERCKHSRSHHKGAEQQETITDYD